MIESASSDVHTSTDQTSSHNWPSWMFYAVAVPLTFASIILPLIAGHIFRSLAQYSIRDRTKFRMIIGSLVYAL